MNLIERYLNEIGRRLPKDKREDICNELRSSLADALESRSLGEPSEADIVAVLEEFGPPEKVVASYSGDRYLIGPRLYPQFVTTLKIVVTVIAGLVVLGSAVAVLSSDSMLPALKVTLTGLVGNLIDSALTSLGIVVVVFALLERLDLRVDIPRERKEWKPRELPAIRDADLVPRFDSIAGIVFPAIILLLLNRFKEHIGISVRGDGARFAIGAVSDPGGELLLNDVVLDNLLWLNLSLLLPMALSVWLFWSGRWHLSTRVLRIGCDVFGLWVFMRICQGVVAARGELVASGLPEQIVDLLLRGAELAPLFYALVVVVSGGKHVYDGWQSARRNDFSLSSGSR
jgi:hypothetical protein